MGSTSGHAPRPAGRRVRALAVAAVLLLGIGVTPAANADRGDLPGVVPSQAEVDAAKADVATKRDAVADIQGELALAARRLEDAALRAEQAAEAYNAARWQLQQARQTVRRAEAESAEAQRTVAEQRDRIAALVAMTYQQGGDLTAVNAFLGPDGPEGVMSEYLAYEGASSSLDAEYQRFSVAASLAEAFQAQAEEARAKQAELVAEAAEARTSAGDAAAAAQAATDQIAAQRTALISALAEAKGISVDLAEQRQTALEERERRREARKARQEAAAAAAAAAAQAAAEAAAAAAAQDDEAPAGETPGDSDPDPATPPASEPGARGSAAKAIAFAKAQLGEPYRWGAAGPSAWDCSGLVMGAWQAGGVSLPHYSAAQYSAGTPIGAGQLRPGDLVFWGSSNNPSSIYHVALYLGNGQIIHAPRTGRPVTTDSMYYWVPPNFFARL